MTLAHVLLPCKMTSQRILRKNLAQVGGRALLELGIDRFHAWFPKASIWVATEDDEVRRIAEHRGCLIYPLNDADLNDQRNVSELFTEWLALRQPTERCCYHQLTSPFTFRHELETAIADTRCYVRSAWIGKLHTPDKVWRLTQSYGETVCLTGNFGVANGGHIVTIQDEATQLSPVSRLSAIDIDSPDELKLSQRIAEAMSLAHFDTVC